MASGTKLMKEISDQFLICKICLEPFKEPKTLSCLHTFCCACVQQQYDTESNRPTRYTLYTRSVTCPLCRKKTDLPTGGVRRLPDNFLVSNLTDVLAKRCVSKVPPCEICHTVRTRSNDACSKCLDCDKLLCRACVELHASTKVTQDHGLIDLEGQKDIECKAHPEETVRFYCQRCEACVCVVCTFQEHKDHEVCSFSDGFARHRVTLESLLTRSKERLSGVSSRLKAIDQYETLSKELKERIRDLAISYTSQVRAREKELIRQVDEVFSEDVTRLAQSKAWLQESFDSLQSACNLTEIVMRDKGVEMLLLKREIQDKLDHLLEGQLPPEPQGLHHLDVQFVPGEVKLGDVFVPGTVNEDDREGGLKGEDGTNGVWGRDIRDVGEKGGNSHPCRDCAERKVREAENSKDREGGKVETKSVYIQTKAQNPLPAAGDLNVPNGYFTTTSSQISLTPAGVSVSHNSMQTATCTVSSRDAATDSSACGNYGGDGDRSMHSRRGAGRARGTMTERQDCRTLKVQTEESCLRDSHLGQAAASGSSYPNTGAAIAAAFLRHKQHDDDPAARSLSPLVPKAASPGVAKATTTHDAEVSTDICLTPSLDNVAAVIAALCGGEPGEGGGLRKGTDRGQPDLLAQTMTPPAPSPSPWIRSRKIQTDISALDPDGGGPAGSDKVASDDTFSTALFGSAGRIDSSSRGSRDGGSGRNSAPTDPASSSPSLARARAARAAAKVSTCEAGVMTPFKVKVVQDTVDKETSAEPVESRTVYIQTRGPRLASTATGTDYAGQMTKGTSTSNVSAVDAETAMPQVSYEARATLTEGVMTSERATCTDGSATTDAATLTMQVRSSDFAVQMRPLGLTAATNTTSPRLATRHSQTSPSLCTRGTMPDPSLLPLPPSPSPSSSSSSSSLSVDPTQPPAASHSPSSVVISLPGSAPLTLPAATPLTLAPAVAKADKATETALTRLTTRAVGPSCGMQSSRTASTDTLQLLQVTDKETSMPTVKTVDDWTHTPQPVMINTGVTPPRPAVLEVGVATVPITLMDQATYTEVRPVRESGTETFLVVCDSETLTEKLQLCDAQTEADVSTENSGTAMDAVETSDGGCMTDDEPPLSPPLPPARESKDGESQCQGPEVASKEVNTTRFRRKAKEVQTSFSYVECVLCQHPDRLEQLEQLAAPKSFTDTSTDPSPPDTHDVGTMALSCLASCPGLTNTAVQTSATQLYDKNVATSFEFDEDFTTRPFLGLESQDAATSTESLPYIGLLSEIDVDELIVIPEANFELVSDSDFDYEPVAMVDDETLTEVPDYVEVGTQTLLPLVTPGEEGTPGLPGPTLVRHEDDCSRNLVSVGVNTAPKVTFEKETSTPIRHLFSKGTMTFYVAKMDKATSTISHPRPGVDAQFRGVGGGGGVPGGRVISSRPRAVNHKVTMTSPTEQRDMAVETDTTLVDGRITHCISKLRNVSERLNSPTARKAVPEGEAFFGQAFPGPAPSQPVVVRVSPARDVRVGEEEQQRQRQLHSLLAQTDAVLRAKDVSPVLRAKDVSPVRKAQPITTLKPRTPVTPGELGVGVGGAAGGYASKSLPRQCSLDRQNKVKMGSQATPNSRLPLLRYNSAPGRIATVPAQTLLSRKSGQTSPRTSPSKIPVSQKPAVMTTSGLTSGACSPVEGTSPGPDSDSFSTSSSQKVQQRPSLPSISETRTPSSCSDSSFLSVESAESSSLNPSSALTSSHSRTPSNVTSVSDTPSDPAHAPPPADVSTGDADGDDSSVSSVSTTLAVPSPVAALTGSDSSLSGGQGKPKKEKKGFMKRLLSGKKKKPEPSAAAPTADVKEGGGGGGGGGGGSKRDSAGGDGNEKTQQQQRQASSSPLPPPSPSLQQKQAKGQTKTKHTDPPTAASVSETACSAPPLAPPLASPLAPPSPPVSTPSNSRPSSTDSASTLTKGGAWEATPSGATAPPPAPPMPPHHYPPLPDPNKSPPPPRKPRPFVYVRQRLLSIQQDNVEEVVEKKEREKEEKVKDKDTVKDTVQDKDKEAVKEGDKAKAKEADKVKDKDKDSNVAS